MTPMLSAAVSDDSEVISPAPPIPWYKNPGLWIGIATPVVAIVNQRYGLKLEPSELALLCSGLASVVVGLFGHQAAHNKAAVDAQGRMAAAQLRLNGSTPMAPMDKLK